MKKIKIFAGGALMLLTFFMLAGCQQNTPPATPGSPTATTTQPPKTAAAVNIQNMAFDEKNVTVAVGATVTWTNNDSLPHTVASDAGLFNSANLSNGQSFSFTFSKEGTYTYHCSLHPSMTGTVVVKS